MDEEEALKAEIAKLSGAIQTHKHHTSYGPLSRSRVSYRGGSNRGSRGAYHTNPVPARNRTLVLNDTSKSAKSQASPSTPDSSENPSAEGWVKRKSTHNMSLLSASTFEKTEPARLAALAATQKQRSDNLVARTPSVQSAATLAAYKGKAKPNSSSVRRGDNMGEVVIDGVVFEFDPSGTKLIKKASQPSPSITTPSTSSTGDDSAVTAVPLKTHVNGQNYVRTKRGNLISAELLAKRRAQKESLAKMQRLNTMVGQIHTIQSTRNSASQARPGSHMSISTARKAKPLCAFFNKTGQCKRGLSCPYVHDTTKIALCPKLLRPAGCTLPSGTCPLSHTPKPQRVPHCVHYLRTGDCRNGITCIYTHSDKLSDGLSTKICRDFSNYAWCDRGQDCTERHTYECPDFVEKGKCSRKGCKLLHVIRAIPQQTSSSSGAQDPATNLDSMQDGDLFMRDDAAALNDDDEDQPDLAEQAGKRKRPLVNSTLDSDDADDNGEDDADVGLTFAHTGAGKRKKARAFAQQNDFISFDDAEDDLDTVADDDEQNSDVDNLSVSDDDEEESVHSEEIDSTDEESNNDDDDGSDNEHIDRNL